MNSLIPIFAITGILIVWNESALAQSEENTYTAPKFGLSMKYPSDWTFVPEEQDFTSGIYDYSVMIPPGSAHLGGFCPTSYVGSNPKVLACQEDSPVEVGITVRKLEPGTTLKKFYDRETAKMQDIGLIETTVLETNKINISGLSAIQTIDLKGGGSLGNLLEAIGTENPKSKHMTAYIVNNSTGYQITGGTNDEKDFDKYVPIIEKMINSFKIQGAKESSDNTAFIPNTKTAPTEDVVLLSQRLKKGDGDNNDIIGQVKNIGSDTVDFVKIGLTVYDKSGDVVGTDSTYSTASTLEPGQKSSFNMISNKENFDGMDSYELSLQWQDSDGKDQYVENAPLYKVK